MKVLLTGHTSGIGKSLFEKFTNELYDVVGFSRKTGHDIGDENIIKNILKETTNCDIFINNAWHPEGQLKLLKELTNIWEDTEKKIINISSNIKVFPDSFFRTPLLLKYKTSKKEIDDFINSYSGNVKIMNVLPGLTRTNFKLDLELLDMAKGMDSNHVANLIYDEFVSNPTNKNFVIEHPLKNL